MFNIQYPGGTNYLSADQATRNAIMQSGAGPLRYNIQPSFTPGPGGPLGYNASIQTRNAQQQQAPAQSSGGGGGYSQPDYRAQTLAAMRQSLADLNAAEGRYGERLGAEYGTQKTALESNRATGLGNLARQKQTTTRQKDISLRDLSQNIRNAYQSGMNRLAVGGAGDSSASKMYGYALGQQEAQNRGKLLSDYNYNLGNIDIQVKNLETDFGNKMRALDQWKASQAFDIAEKFREARDRINQQMAGLGGGAVSLAQSQLAQQAASQLANLSAQVGSAASIIQNDYSKAAAELKNYQQENFNPDVAIEQQNIPGQAIDYYAPLARRDEEQQVV